jgi:hypothetical protein
VVSIHNPRDSSRVRLWRDRLSCGYADRPRRGPALSTWSSRRSSLKGAPTGPGDEWGLLRQGLLDRPSTTSTHTETHWQKPCDSHSRRATPSTGCRVVHRSQQLSRAPPQDRIDWKSGDPRALGCENAAAREVVHRSDQCRCAACQDRLGWTRGWARVRRSFGDVALCLPDKASSARMPFIRWRFSLAAFGLRSDQPHEGRGIS